MVIHVKDVNDNPPVFERPTYRTQITEEDDRNLPKSVLRASVSMTNFLSFFSVLQLAVVLCNARFLLKLCLHGGVGAW